MVSVDGRGHIYILNYLETMINRQTCSGNLGLVSPSWGRNRISAAFVNTIAIGINMFCNTEQIHTYKLENWYHFHCKHFQTNKKTQIEKWQSSTSFAASPYVIYTNFS